MNNDDKITVLRYIERIIQENNLRRDDLRVLDRREVEKELAAIARALELQAREYERRLEILNHAHEQARQVLNTYVTRDLYDRAHFEVVEWQRKADVRLSEYDNRLKHVELGIVNLPGGVKSLEIGLATQAGQHLGSRMTMTTAITIIVAVFVAIGGVIALMNYLK